jgi:tetratricopeptide (TPR) repeat protein
MQDFFKKIFIFLLFNTFVGNVTIAQSIDIEAADSLFKIKKYREALFHYKNSISHDINKSPNDAIVYFKAAYCAKQIDDYTQELYYLSIAYNKRPRFNLLNKLSEIATRNNLLGYDNNNIGFIVLFFRKYIPFAVVFLISIAAYVLAVVLYKIRKQQNVKRQHKIVLLVYLMTVVIILNLPDIYQIAIVRKKTANLRNSPSSASIVVSTIKKGNKIDIIQAEGEWLQIFWKKKFYYIRQADVWLIK